jgi:hypothetical protein
MSDHWESYMTNIDHKIGTILLDFGIRQDAPSATLTELTWLDLRYHTTRPDGLPEPDEFERLNKVDDVLEAAASQSAVRIAYVGRSTSDGKRLYFFYSSDSTSTERAITSALSAHPDYRFELGSKLEPDWNAYFEYLFPDARQYQSISNGHVLRALEGHGDDHAIEREVDHWAYFENRFDRAQFIETVCEKGFRVVGESDDPDNEPSYGVHLSGIHAVDHNTIDAITVELFDCAKEHSGIYDGWETVIVKQNPPER